MNIAGEGARAGRRAGWITAIAVAAALGFTAGCGDLAGEMTSIENAAIGTCARGDCPDRPRPACLVDDACPCGWFCDTADHTCRPACMTVPGIQADGCVTTTSARCLGRRGRP
jgi:hypothetical protein